MAAPSRPLGTRPSTPLAPACRRRPRAGQPRGSVSSAASLSSSQPFSLPVWSQVILFLKVAFFCMYFFFSNFLHHLLLFVICVFPKHVPSELHRRYTSLEEMLQSQSVWSPQLAWYWLICQRCHPTVLIYK